MKKLVFSALVAAASLGSYIYYKSKKEFVPLPREKVLRILIELNNQSYIVFFNIANLVEKALKINPTFEPAQIQHYLQTTQNDLFKKLEEIEKQIYKLVDVKQQDFQDSIQKCYKNDDQIQHYLNHYQQTYKKSLLGIHPQLEQKTPIFLNQTKILNIVSQIFEQHSKITQSQIKKLTKKVTLQELNKNVEIKLKDFKNNLSKQLKLTGLKDSLNQILEFAVAKYSQNNVEFKKKYEHLTKQYFKRTHTLIVQNQNSFIEIS